MVAITGRRLRGCAALAVLLGGVSLSALPARGGSSSATLQVSVTVVATCIVTASHLNFGAYTGRDVYATGTISARCNGPVGYHIALDAGSHYDGNWRAVSNMTQRIPYGLYLPSGHEWGDEDFADTYKYGYSLAGTGTGEWQSIPVSGVLHGGVTGIPKGTYQDLVTATIYF